MNRKGIELAVDEINARPERRGSPLRVVYRDDEGDGEKASRIAQEFVDSLDISAVIGHVNSGAMVSAAQVYDGRLAAVATTATSPALTGISPWAFRVISSDSANGIDIAKFAARSGLRRAAILYENNTYGRGLAFFVLGARLAVVLISARSTLHVCQDLWSEHAAPPCKL